MNSSDRKKEIINILSSRSEPTPGTELAQMLGVSRQVIVQDVALIRANGYQIFSTTFGYVLQQPEAKQGVSRVLKLIHSDADTRRELNIIVDAGGKVEDVFVYHKAYGKLKARIDIASRRDIDKYLEEIESGKSGLLKNVTSGYHYHTITAKDKETLDLIEKQLEDAGFIAPILEFEPEELGK